MAVTESSPIKREMAKIPIRVSMWTSGLQKDACDRIPAGRALCLNHLRVEPRTNSTNLRLALRLLVSRAAIERSPRTSDAPGDVARYAAGDRTQTRWLGLRHARQLPAPRYSALLRTLRWRAGAMQLPRLVLRAEERTMPRDPVSYRRFQAESGSHLRERIPLRGTRRIFLDIHAAQRRLRAGWTDADRQHPSGATGANFFRQIHPDPSLR